MRAGSDRLGLRAGDQIAAGIELIDSECHRLRSGVIQRQARVETIRGVERQQEFLLWRRLRHGGFAQETAGGIRGCDHGGYADGLGRADAGSSRGGGALAIGPQEGGSARGQIHGEGIITAQTRDVDRPGRAAILCQR